MERLRRIPRQRALIGIAVISGCFVLALGMEMRAIGRDMARYDIIAFELAHTQERAREIFAAWGERGMDAARRSLHVDFGFIPAYAVCLSSLVLLAARASSRGWQAVGVSLLPAPFVAGLCDVIENLALLRVFDVGVAEARTPLRVAWAAADVKFALVYASAGYVLLALIAKGLSAIGRR